MGCGCNKEKLVVKSYVKLGSNGEVLPNDETHDLVGKDIITLTAKSGKVIENITKSNGTVIGYIVLDGTGKTFSVFRSQVLQKK